jgi:branched-chain amino acid transport system substrate-binding protein
MRFAVRSLPGAALAALLFTSSLPALADDFKVGTILSTTGPSAFLGGDMKDGMAIAVDEINARGGIDGKPINWTFYDAQSQTATAIASTRRLIAQDHVDIIVGGGNMSGIAQAMVPLAEQAKIPFMSTEGAASIVNPVAQRQWIFKSTVDDSVVFERLADYFRKKGITKIALLHDTSGFGQAAVQELAKVAPERGLTTIDEAFNPTDTDLTPQLTRIKSSGAQAIVCWTTTPAGVIFIKQAKQLGLGDRTLIHSYGFVSQRYMELAGKDADGVLLVSVKFPVGADLPDTDPLKPRIATLTAAFQKRFGRAPNQFVAQSYDAVYLAAQALKAGHGERGATRDALEKISKYDGVEGTFNFSPTHHSGLSKDDLVLIAWKDNRFRLVDYR